MIDLLFYDKNLDKVIVETKEMRNDLLKLCEDKDEKIAFLAKYIKALISHADSLESYALEQSEYE